MLYISHLTTISLLIFVVGEFEHLLEVTSKFVLLGAN